MELSEIKSYKHAEELYYNGIIDFELFADFIDTLPIEEVEEIL